MEGRWLPVWNGRVLDLRNGLEGFWLPAIEKIEGYGLRASEWEGSGCIGMEMGSVCIGMEGFWLPQWNQRILAAYIGMEGFMLPAFERKGSGCRHWKGRVLAVGIGLKGFWLLALELKGFGSLQLNGRVLATGFGME